MTSALLPELNGRRLTVDVALKQQNLIRTQIAKLADTQIVLPKFFHALGAPVTGGGMLYSVIQASDFYTTNIEKRSPGNEYKVVEGVDPEPKVATVEDWGGKFQVPDEAVSRNDTNYLDQQTTQLANTIARKLDTAAMEVIEDAAIESIAGNNWASLVIVGPEADLTPSIARPTADLSSAQLAADLEELGVTHNLLVVHPNEAHSLRTAYGEGLDAMLKSAGVKLFSNPRVEAGVAWAVQAGEVGTVGFEKPLTVEVWDDRSTRSKWVQSYAVPAFAVDRPFAAKKIIGLA
ncbi:major capsid protein [Gordonia amicalis]|uniref:major capsid protein n=1 Tax=Gordonia amicalis TaxID=89053 RepID=UPI0029541DB6|nr:major capsid protein [Gordonia amicalis]MDV7101661.1 major capsid protein [Gordonia amicalis]